VDTILLRLLAGIKMGSPDGYGNFEPELIASVRVRKFDGANTWKFFDELPAHEVAPPSEA
jgi:hypothetical protein